MTETDNILEILLRLVRTERAYAQSTQTSTVSNVSGPLLNALSQGWAHAEQQNHITLSVLSIFRMASEYAKKALSDEKGKVEVEDVLARPQHTPYAGSRVVVEHWLADERCAGKPSAVSVPDGFEVGDFCACAGWWGRWQVVEVYSLGRCEEEATGGDEGDGAVQWEKVLHVRALRVDGAHAPGARSG